MSQNQLTLDLSTTINVVTSVIAWISIAILFFKYRKSKFEPSDSGFNPEKEKPQTFSTSTKMINRVCRYCGDVFVATAKNQQYCPTKNGIKSYCRNCHTVNESNKKKYAKKPKIKKALGFSD